MKTVGIYQQYFSCCKAVLTQSQGLFSFSHHPASEELEVHKKLRGDTPIDQRDIPYHVVSCSSIKYGVKKRKGRMFGVMEFVFPRNHYVWWALLSWKWLNIWSCGCGCCPWKCEWTPCFALFAWVAFALPRELSLPQPTSSHTFTFPILCPSHLGRGHAWLRGAELLLG